MPSALLLSMVQMAGGRGTIVPVISSTMESCRVIAVGGGGIARVHSIRSPDSRVRGVSSRRHVDHPGRGCRSSAGSPGDPTERHGGDPTESGQPDRPDPRAPGRDRRASRRWPVGRRAQLGLPGQAHGGPADGQGPGLVDRRQRPRLGPRDRPVHAGAGHVRRPPLRRTVHPRRRSGHRGRRPERLAPQRNGRDRPVRSLEHDLDAGRLDELPALVRHQHDPPGRQGPGHLRRRSRRDPRAEPRDLRPGRRFMDCPHRRTPRPGPLPVDVRPPQRQGLRVGPGLGDCGP